MNLICDLVESHAEMMSIHDSNARLIAESTDKKRKKKKSKVLKRDMYLIVFRMACTKDHQPNLKCSLNVID